MKVSKKKVQEKFILEPSVAVMMLKAKLEKTPNLAAKGDERNGQEALEKLRRQMVVESNIANDRVKIAETALQELKTKLEIANI